MKKTNQKKAKAKKAQKKNFTIRVLWTVGKDYEIEVESPEKAKEIVENMVNCGDVCVWNDGFTATDDVQIEVI